MDSFRGRSRVILPLMLMYKVPGVIIGVGNSNKLLNITDLFALPAKKILEEINMVYRTQHPDGLRKSLIFLGLRNVNLTNLI